MTDKVTEKQLQKLKHALGIDMANIKKQKSYHAYRNHYLAPESDNDWKHLVKTGLAEQGRTTQTGIFYHVTKKGMDCIGRILGIKIMEDSN